MMLMYGSSHHPPSNFEYPPHSSFNQGIPPSLRMMDPMDFRPPLQESNEDIMISLSIPSCLPFHHRNWASLLANDFRKAESSSYITTPNRLAFLRYTADEVMRETCTSIQILGPPSHSSMLTSLPSHFNITLWGPYRSVRHALNLLQTKAQLFQLKQSLHLPIHLIPYHDQIKECVEEIAINHGLFSQWYHERNSTDEYIFELYGSNEALMRARLAILLAFDRFSDRKEDIYHLTSENHSALIALLAGPHRHRISRWVSEYDAHIYLPPSYELSKNLLPTNSDLINSKKIYMTASSSGKLSAIRELINKELDNVRTSIQHTFLNCSSRKLDLLLNEKPYAFESVLINNGCFASINPLDEISYSVTLYSTASTHMEDCLLQLYELLSEYQSAELAVSFCPSFLSSSSTTSLTSFSHFNVSNLSDSSTSSNESSSLQFKGFSDDVDSLRRVSQTTGLEIIYANGFIELFGRTEQVIAGLNICQSCSWISSPTSSLLQVKFQFEQPSEVKEFVCGKKDGKLNKIMRSTGSLVTMEGDTGGGPNWSVNICIYADSIMSALESLDMVQGELPADLSFYIPELHHKRIIGHGGKNIQKIMKAFGVYVKFLNNEEVRLKYGLSSDSDKETWPLSREYYANVLVKTPTKNANALERMKRAILELSGERDLTPTSDFILVPSHYQSWMLSQDSRLEEMEKLTQVQIYWPPLEWQFDEIQLKGSSYNLTHAKQLLVEMMPAYSSFYIEPLVNNEDYLIEYFKSGTSNEWQDLKKKVLKDWKVKIMGPCELLLASNQSPVGITALVSQSLGPNLSQVYSFIKDSLKVQKMVVMGSSGKSQRPYASRRNSYHFTKDPSWTSPFGLLDLGRTSKRLIKTDPMVHRSRSQSFGEVGMTNESFKHFNSVLLPASGASFLRAKRSVGQRYDLGFMDHVRNRPLVSPTGVIGERTRTLSYPFPNSSSSSSELSLNGLNDGGGDLKSSSTHYDSANGGGEHEMSGWGHFERRTSLVDGLEITDEEKKRHSSLFIKSISEWKTPIPGERVLEPPLSPISSSLFSLRRSDDGQTKNFEELSILLKSLQLEKYIELFIEKNIDLEDLGGLSDDDLKDLGIIAFTSRKTLLKRVEEWKYTSFNKHVSERLRTSRQRRQRSYYHSVPTNFEAINDRLSNLMI